MLAANADIDTLDPHKSASFNVHNRVGLVYNRLLAFETGAGRRLHRPGARRRPGRGVGGRRRRPHLHVPPARRRALARHAAGERPAVRGRRRGRHLRAHPGDRLPAYMLENVDEHRGARRPHGGAPAVGAVRPAPQLHGEPLHVDPPAGGGRAGRRPGRHGHRHRPVHDRASASRNVETVYGKNPDYFEEGKPYLDGVRRSWSSPTRAPGSPPSAPARSTSRRARPEELDAVRRRPRSHGAGEPRLRGLDQLYVERRDRRRSTTSGSARRSAMAIDREAMGEAIYGGGEFTGPCAGARRLGARPRTSARSCSPTTPSGPGAAGRGRLPERLRHHADADHRATASR